MFYCFIQGTDEVFTTVFQVEVDALEVGVGAVLSSDLAILQNFILWHTTHGKTLPLSATTMSEIENYYPLN